MMIYLQTIDTAEDRSKFEQLYEQYKQLMFYTAFQILKRLRTPKMRFITPF